MIKVLIGATVVEVGALMVIIANWLFPKRANLTLGPLRGQRHVGVEEGFFDAVAAQDVAGVGGRNDYGVRVGGGRGVPGRAGP